MSMTLTRGGTRAGQVARQDGRDTVTHFNGTERVDGALVALPAGVDRGTAYWLWDSFGARQVKLSYIKDTMFTTRFLRAQLARFGLAAGELEACSSNASRRCRYPEHLRGFWNVTHLFQAPALFSLPFFEGADEAVWSAYGGARAAATNAFTARVNMPLSSQWHLDIEPETGIPARGRRMLQNNLVAYRSDILYPKLGLFNASSVSALGGTLVPLWWMDIR
mmetsp:Transcript_21580/g.66839  ORF Transcript_21580/g.66839 Transcript_21580/m.66839 type:complete len:221 (-) Transcript_21580:438-1100(-)